MRTTRSGLRECVRLLAHNGRILVADRDHEAGLLTRLFYGGGIGGMLEQADNRDIWDGNAERVSAQPLLHGRGVYRHG